MITDVGVYTKRSSVQYFKLQADISYLSVIKYEVSSNNYHTSIHLNNVGSIEH